MSASDLKLRFKSLREREDGFSLVEIVVAMVLIGLIAVIAIPVLDRGTKTVSDVSVNAAVGLRMEKDIEYLRDNSYCPQINAMVPVAGTAPTTITVGKNRSYVYTVTATNGVTATAIRCSPGSLITVTFSASTPAIAATGSNPAVPARVIATRSVQLFAGTETGTNKVLT